MTEKLKFTKMNGLGNDFVVIDAREKKLALTPPQVQWLAVRHNPVTKGCDQVLVIHPPRKGGDVFMQIFNADGGEVDACGNGARAVAAYLHKNNNNPSPKIETLGGLLECVSNLSSEQENNRAIVQVTMPSPKFGWQDIPLAEAVENTSAVKLHPDLPPAFLVNVGNPHAVFFVDSLVKLKNYETSEPTYVTDTKALMGLAEKYGEQLENDSRFADRANINFACRAGVKWSAFSLVTWERGVSNASYANRMTRACGTGACATAVAATILNSASEEEKERAEFPPDPRDDYMNAILPKGEGLEHDLRMPVTISDWGGDNFLHVRYHQKTDMLTQEGHALFDFADEVELSQ